MIVRCVGAVIRDDRGRLLLIKRGRPPGAGLWSLPGGRVEAGETDEQAVVREVREETGLRVSVGPLIGSVRRRGPDGPDGPVTYDIHDYAATVLGGNPVAGDDASAVDWVAEEEVRSRPTSPGLVETLAGWGVIPVR